MFGLAIFPQAGSPMPTRRRQSRRIAPATPGGQIGTDAHGQPERAAGTAHFDFRTLRKISRHSAATYGFGASSAIAGAERLSSSEPKM